MEFKDNMPFAAKGLGVDTVWFSGGRTAAALGKHGGITEVRYYGIQPLGRERLFTADKLSTFTKLFRLTAVVDGKPYYLEFDNTVFYPFGCASEFKIGGVKLSHRMILLNDAIVQGVTILSNPAKKPVALKLITMGAAVRVNMQRRTWDKFTIEDGVGLWMKATDIPEEEKDTGYEAMSVAHKKLYFHGSRETEPVETHICVSADKPVVCRHSPQHFKYWMETEVFSDSAFVFTVFGNSGDDVRKRAEHLRRHAASETVKKLEAHETRRRNLPAVACGDERLESFLMNQPAMIDCLKVDDIPGGMRASAGHYWIWGWDSMVHCDATLLAKDGQFVCDMLDLYRNLADRDIGIPHQVTLQMKPRLAMAFPAQCLYVIMLYNYYCFTGDAAAVKEYLDFALWILSKCVKDRISGRGLIGGASLFPDTPQYAGHDGNDVSVFNNSIYYQALRAMARLVEAPGAASAGGQYRELVSNLPRLAEETRSDFTKYFFDEKKGYFVDSISGADFSRRKHYPVYAILWVTEFAGDLVRGVEKQVASFMKANFPAPHGLYMYPVWDSCYGGDGNQMQAYFPATDPFYYNMMRLAGNTAELKRLCENITWYWQTRTIPEGFTYDADNEGIGLDNPGCNQAFGGKAWYSIFFNAICGIGVGFDGISFSPADPGMDIKVKNLEIRGKRIDISIAGKGWNIKGLMLNGKEVEHPFRIPYAELKKNNKIEMLRGGKVKDHGIAQALARRGK